MPHAHRAKLALELPDNYTLHDLPCLDYDYYIAQAQKLLDSALASVEVERGTSQARALQDMGLTLVPTRGGKNPVGVKLDDIDKILLMENRRCETWSVVSGAVTETLVLDIDIPASLDPAFLKLIQAYPTLTTWHGQGNADEVRAGLKRGAIIYRYDGQDARITTRATKQWAEKHGFEVAYGKKLQTVIGQHREVGDDYVQDGVVAEAPSELIEFLGLRLGTPRKRKETTPDSIADADLEILRQAADVVLGVGWASLFQTREGFRGVDGITPGLGSRMRLGVNHGRVWGHTFHVSYEIRGTISLVQAEYDRRRPDPSGPGTGPGPDRKPNQPKPDPAVQLDASDTPSPPDEEAQRTAKDCEEAINQITGIGLILGTTGTGKTWQATKHTLDRHDAGDRTLLVAPDKEGIEQMRRYLIDHWTKAGRDPKDLRMQVLVSTNAKDEAEEGDDSANSSKSDIKESTLIVITHHHFTSRKPLTKRMYAVLYWVEEHGAEVIIDEIDLYIERQNHDLQLDARYMLMGGERGHWTRGNHCPSSSGSFRCKSCTKRSAGRVVNLDTHFDHQTPFKLLPSQFSEPALEEFVIDPENLPLGQTIDLADLNIRLSSIVQTPGYLQQRDFSRQHKKLKSENSAELSAKQEFLSYLRDTIDCSYMPTMAVPLAKDDQGEAVQSGPS